MVRREGAGTAKQPPWRRRIENLVLGDARRKAETHQWMWDRVTLTAVLEESGFTDIEVLDHRTSRIPEWAEISLDTLTDGSPYKPHSLYVEGVKR